MLSAFPFNSYVQCVARKKKLHKEINNDNYIIREKIRANTINYPQYPIFSLYYILYSQSENNGFLKKAMLSNAGKYMPIQHSESFLH